MRNPLFVSGGTYEVVIPGTPTLNGYFANEKDLNTAVAPYDGHVQAIYVRLNPVKPELLAHAPNCLNEKKKYSACDIDITRRLRFFFDFDPIRDPTDISSTDAEHQASIDLALTVMEDLRDIGWPEGILADSGNGAHLVYWIDLPNDEPATDLIRKILQYVSAKFSTDVVKVDTRVFNASRLIKLYGTWVRKGPNTAERPHRRSQILARPILQEMQPVPPEVLAGLASMPLPKAERPQKRKDGAVPPLEETRDMLAVIPAENRDWWRETFIILGRTYNRSDDAWAVGVEWAAKWGGKKGRGHDKIMRQAFYELSQQESERELTIATIIQRAREHGWVPTVERRLAQLRALPLAELSATWHTYLEGLTAVGVHTLMTEVKRLTGIGINTLKQALAEHRANAQRAAIVARTGDRTAIPFFPEDVCKASNLVETAMLARLTDGDCIRFGDTVVRVSVDAMPHAHQADSDLPATPTAQLDLLTRPKLLPLVERAVVLEVETPCGPDPIGVPVSVLDQILANPNQIPKVSALVTHPIVTLAGRILSASGIDPTTRLLLYGSAIEALRPYSQDEACDAAKDIVRVFLDGFEFATDLDKACAVALIVTAVERKLLNMAPGFLITAAQQSLGKTTLARLTHLVLTGTDAPVFTWPEDEVEVQKLLLSTLLRNPAMVCIDNVGDGMTFRSPALSSAMTSATKQGRILGHSRDAVVSTSVLFVITGNNVELANDEASRWIPVHLTTKDASPHTRTFDHPDVLRHGLEIREEVLRHVVGIVAGYRQSADRLASLSRFPQWDELVRQPLMWAGLPDIGTVFNQNIASSPELGAHLALMMTLVKAYGVYDAEKNPREFSAANLVDGLINKDPAYVKPGEATFYGTPLKEALLALHTKDPENARSVGHALAKACGRNAVVEGGVLFLARSSLDGLARYRVEKR